MGLTRAVLVFFSLASASCSAWTEISGGPIVALPTRRAASPGGSLEVHGGLGTSAPHGVSTLGVDANAKMRATPATQHLAFGEGFFYTHTIGRSGAATARAGLHLVFERYDEKLLVGGGPYAQIMGGIAVDEDRYFVPGAIFAHTRRDRTLVTFGPTAEIDARFSRPTAVAILGLAVGIAWATEVVEPGPTEPIDSAPPFIREPAPDLRPR